MSIPYLQIYPAEIKALICDLNAAQQNKIFNAILNYGLFQKWEIDTENNKRFEIIFQQISEKITQSAQEYLDICKQNRKNAKARWKRNTDVCDRKATAVQKPNKSDMRPQCQQEQEQEQETTKETSPLSFLLADLIKANNPNAKLPNNFKTWAQEEEKLLRIDKRPLEEAVQVLKWSQASAFWKANILSIPKFREKYDTLKLQMQNRRGGNMGSKPSALPSPKGKYDFLEK